VAEWLGNGEGVAVRLEVEGRLGLEVAVAAEA
jgi:hypothetical protein